MRTVALFATTLAIAIASTPASPAATIPRPAWNAPPAVLYAFAHAGAAARPPAHSWIRPGLTPMIYVGNVSTETIDMYSTSGVLMGQNCNAGTALGPRDR